MSGAILVRNCRRVEENVLFDIYVSTGQVMERCIVGVITSRKTDFRADHELIRCSSV